MDNKLRKAKESDLPNILALINELALFEKAPEEVTNTIKKMKQDGFGEKPIFWSYVAEKKGIIVGVAICYLRYSTWKGVRLYLEDLVVTEDARGNGIGKMLFEACVENAKKNGYSGISWQVLNWNTPAINFYKKYDAKLDGNWINGSIEF